MGSVELQGLPGGLHLRLLGSLQLTAEHETVQLPPSAQRVVAFLGLQPRPVRRTTLAEVLWPEVDDVRAHGNLRSALWRLRRISSPLIEGNDDNLELSGDASVDLREAIAAGRRILGPAPAPPDAEGALAIFSSDLLPDWTDGWIEFERERFRELRLHVLERVCRMLTTDGRFAEAVEVGLLAVSAEPLRESSHRALIDAHLAEGNRGRALQQYQMLRLMLFTELGIEPTTQVADLAVEVSSG